MVFISCSTGKSLNVNLASHVVPVKSSTKSVMQRSFSFFYSCYLLAHVWFNESQRIVIPSEVQDFAVGFWVITQWLPKSLWRGVDWYIFFDISKIILYFKVFDIGDGGSKCLQNIWNYQLVRHYLPLYLSQVLLWEPQIDTGI